MKFHGFNLVFILLIFAYIFYINYQSPTFLYDIFNNVFTKVIILTAIVLITIGHSSGIGGLLVGLLLAISYVITSDLLSSRQNESFQNFPNRYYVTESEEDEDSPVGKVYEKCEKGPCPFRAEEKGLKITGGDPLPEESEGLDGPFAQSGIGYQFGLA